MMDQRASGQLNTDRLINVLIGAGDGIIVPSAVVAGMTAASFPDELILRNTLIVTAIAALIMGIGGYLTRKNAELQPRNSLKDELHSGNTGTREFFANLGMTEEMQEVAITEMAKDDEEWKSFIERYDLDPSTETPARSGLIIGLSYLFSGAIIVLPFAMALPQNDPFMVSVCIALPLLFLLGALKGRITGQHSLIKGLTLMGTGVMAIAATWLVIRWFAG
jgi:vacuolar iron transporter family protein